MSKQQAGRQGRGGGIVDAAGGVVAGVVRVVGLPIRLLPQQSRAHVRNAIRELGYGFAEIPRDLADLASAEVDRWVGEAAPAGDDVTLSPVVAAEPVAAPVAAPVAKVVAAEPVAAPVAAPVAKVVVAEPVAAPVAAPIAKVVVAEPVAEVVAEPIAAEPVAEVVAEPIAAEPVAEVVAEPAAAEPATAASPVIIGVDIAHIEYDPPGQDVDGEYVLIWNTTAAPVDMSGWELSDGDAKHIYTFAAFSIEPDAEVKLWTKRGSDDASNLHWNSRTAIWNNEGDTGTLRDTSGAVVSTYTYTGKAKGPGKRKKS